MEKRAILIAGPTASGKSALAIDLAQRHVGVIINADSMQVYRDLRILTARPDDAELTKAPHKLYGHVAADTRYSVGSWLEDAKAAIQEAEDAGRLPIFVGGTGLYFKALTEGLADIPDIPDEIFSRWSERDKHEGSESLHTILSKRDSRAAAALKAGDSQRIVRALSVLEATGRSIVEWQNRPGSKPLLSLADCDAKFLMPDRQTLYDRIDARLNHMIGQGALNEVERLMEKQLDPSLPIMRAHGVPHFIAMLSGELDEREAVRRAKADTRHYAKRQVTWFRHQMAGWQEVEI